ncbi:MAG: site-specific DNA-methyltransferase [Caulobacteraceae bacterium]|nr:site-specific DNA-methyltransferase [Caulobacteraceae bacterium]
MIAWVYGSGFPKSLDVSKAIDKMDAAQEQQARRYRFTEWVRSTGITSKQIDEATQTNMGGHYTTAASQPAIMTREHLEACRHLLGEIPEWVEREADIRSVESKNFAEREVVGQKIINGEEGTAGGYKNGIASIQGANISINRSIDITIAATSEAKQWEGWGTALKPALEPITVARKPLIGTVAENVLQHGTGAINVDGGRVGERWPANFIHDGSEEVVGLFPQTTSGAKKPNHKRIGGYGGDRPKQVYGTYKQIPCDYPSNSGSAARFFYCAKASKADRDEGCDKLQERSAGECVDRVEGSAGMESPRAGAGRTSGSRNHHPTVKPTDLMRYLCRLVTPPNGIVLDPFMGSGSTGKAAMLEGFAFVGIEREAEYIDIAKARIQSAVGLL